MDVFEPQGALQLYVESLQPSGFGDLAVRFEQLKARLSAEGLFDAARKRPLPDRPAVIAVVTSPTGAVWRDVCNVLARRWPLARVVLVACQVQGEAAPASIVSALRRLERWIGEAEANGRPGDAPAVTILARGGGSLEDLWSFNDERVVRAIVAHPVPVVCGVGHEVDVTLADFAADVRAPTPSAAAELVVPDRADALTALRARRRRLDDLVRAGLAAAGREVAAERRLLDRLDPAVRLAESRERAGLLLDRATRATLTRVAGARAAEERVAGRQHALAATRIARSRATLDASGSALAALGPQATLERGYAIVRRRDDGAIVRFPHEAPGGTGLRVDLAGGDLAATVDDAASAG
jgi:exodeoxyribonuclease VII large subunit